MPPAERTEEELATLYALLEKQVFALDEGPETKRGLLDLVCLLPFYGDLYYDFVWIHDDLSTSGKPLHRKTNAGLALRTELSPCFPAVVVGYRVN